MTSTPPLFLQSCFMNKRGFSAIRCLSMARVFAKLLAGEVSGGEEREEGGGVAVCG
jgi:hypothetical protein